MPAAVSTQLKRAKVTIAGEERATSHYVNAAAYQSRTDALNRLAGLDVGSHGYYHHTYLTYEENLLNVRRGIETLQQHGIEPRLMQPAGKAIDECVNQHCEYGG